MSYDDLMMTPANPGPDTAQHAYKSWLAGKHSESLDALANAASAGDLSSAGLLVTLSARPEAPSGARGLARTALEAAPAGPVLHRHLAYLRAAGFGGEAEPDEALRLRLADAQDGDGQALTELALLAICAGETAAAGTALVRAAAGGQAHAIAALLRIGLGRGHLPAVARAQAAALARSGHPLGAALEAATSGLEIREPEQADANSGIDGPVIAAIGRWLGGPLPESLTLSADPPVARTPGFLPPVICDYLVANAAPHLQPARILDPSSGESRADPYRTSLTASLPDGVFDIVLWAIKHRMAKLAGLDLARGEALSVLAYRTGDQYRAHFDFLTADNGPVSADLARRGQRIATTLVRLNEGFDGGATVFPRLDIRWSGALGEALVFRNVTPDERGDKRTLHAGETVTGGMKLLASLWLRERP